MSKTPSANIVDNSLVLSLPQAINPVVWRMELAKAKMSAIEIREDSLGEFTLVLKTPKGDADEIARFKARNDALKGLGAITSAMNKAEKREEKERKNEDKKISIFKNIIFGGVALIAVVFIYIIVSSIIMTLSGNYAADPALLSAYNSGQLQDGVPQSADDFLKAQ